MAMKFVGDNLRLNAVYVKTEEPLSEATCQQICAECIEVVRGVDKMLHHLVDIKVVRNERRNFINVRIKGEFMRLLMHHKIDKVYYCFFPEYNLEPFVRIRALHEETGELTFLTDEQRLHLKEAVKKFKSTNGITNESYLYGDNPVSPHVAQTLEEAVAKSLQPSATQQQQRQQGFNVRMRVASAMYTNVLTILNPLGFKKLRDTLAKLVETDTINAERWKIMKALNSVNGIYPKILNVSSNPMLLDLRRMYVPTLYAVQNKNGVLFGFYISDKIEPYVITSLIDPDDGRVRVLTRALFDEFVSILQDFQDKFNIKNATYHYTPLKERQETDAFVKRGGASTKAKAHSSDFHLKIRVDTAFYTHHMRILQLVNMDSIIERLEPVQYNYNREAHDWETVRQIMQNDCS